MDSTACLVGSDAPYIDPSFQFVSVRQRDMEEDNPIARHGKLQVTLVAAKLCFFRLSKERAHAWMRHVSLDRYARSRERFARGFGQLEGDRNGSDARGLRRNFVLNRNKRPRFQPSGTAGRE